MIVIWVTFRLPDLLIEIIRPILAKTDEDLVLQLEPILKKSFRTLVLIIGGIMIIHNLGYSVGSLLAGLVIGGMALALQAKLLRVLKEKEFARVGGLMPLPCRARVVCATHRDLQAMAREKTFREDLLYRLAVSEIHLPCLRERRSDIPVLVEHFIAKLGAQLHKRVNGIDDTAMRRLAAYDWHGNVRELENVLARAIALARTPTLGMDDIEFPMSRGSASLEPEKIEPLSVAEKRHVEKALAATDWNITQTAKLLEISPTTLRKKIADCDLKHA